MAIARGLAMNPALVLADEPSGNLDTQNADAILGLMREVNASVGTTFLTSAMPRWPTGHPKQAS